MTEESLEMSRFLDLIKKETGKEIKPFDAVFHKDYAKFRHLPYVPPEGKDNDNRNPCIRKMTWINVILHDGMTDSLRKILFPHQFDLGNTSLGKKKTAKISDLLEDLNNKADLDYKWTSESIYYQDLKTVKEGLQDIFGYDFSNTKSHPVKSLKVIKLLQRVKKRKSSLFGLIKPPHKLEKLNIDFRDDAKNTTNENDSLLIADLISYLSIEVPKDKLKVIHTHTLSSSKLTETARVKLLAFTGLMRNYHKDNNNFLSKAYNDISLKIDKYVVKKNKNIAVPLDEELYIYLITLELQHFSSSQKKLMGYIKKEYSARNIKHEIDDFCTTLSKQHKKKIAYDTKFVSVKGFIDLANNHKNKLWKLTKFATGIETRSYLKDEIISHAQKILALHNIHSFDEKNIENDTLSISDCIAAICTVVLEKENPTKYEPYIFGQKPGAKNPLFYFDTERSIEDLIETDFIPHSINQIMYANFNNVYFSLIGNIENNIRKSFLNLQDSFIKKFTECIQQGSIDSAMASEGIFEIFTISMAKTYIPQIPELPNDLHKAISMWMHDNND